MSGKGMAGLNDLEAAGGGSIVRFKEAGFRDMPAGARAMLDCSTGWGEAMTLWKYCVEHGLQH